MGFMDQLRKLTQPYDDEDDFFEGSSGSLKPKASVQASVAQKEMERSFSAEEETAEAESAKAKPAEGGRFANFGIKRQAKPKPRKERLVSFGGNETQVILFNPKSLDEAGELMDHLLQGRSLVMTFEGISDDLGRRLLDFSSGIIYALQGKITPVSAKTYFVAPQNVDIKAARHEQPESDEQYF